MTKDRILDGVLALNGDDKKYLITVDGDRIITELKWMDPNHFEQYCVTDEMRNFRFTVTLHGNKTWSEKTTNTYSSDSGSDISGFKGKSISFSKTIEISKKEKIESDNSGTVDLTFRPEEYQAPVREYLTQCGLKPKKNTLLIAIIAIFAIIILAALATPILLCTSGACAPRTPITTDEFCTYAEEANLEVEDVSNSFSSVFKRFHFTSAYMAYDDSFNAIFWDLRDSDSADELYEFLCSETEYNDNITSHTQVSAMNYDYTTYKSKNAVYRICRVENTVLIAAAEPDCKAQLDAFVKTIGY